MTSCLVVGGAGYLGVELTRRLANEGKSVTVLDRMMYGEEALAGLPVTVVAGDACDPDTVARVVKGVDTVFFAAGLVGDSACNAAPKAAYRMNVDSVRTVADCLRGRDVRFLLLSSGSVYGRDCALPATEEADPCPDSTYSSTRLSSEQAVLEAGLSAATILRLGGLFGWSARMRFDLPINYMTACAVREGVIELTDTTTQCPYIHVDDVVSVALLVASLPRNRPVDGIINVGWDSLTVTNREAAAVVSSVTGCQVRVMPGGPAANYSFSFQRLSALGIEPQWTIADGVRDMANRLHEIDDFRAPRYYNAAVAETLQRPTDG